MVGLAQAAALQQLRGACCAACGCACSRQRCSESLRLARGEELAPRAAGKAPAFAHQHDLSFEQLLRKPLIFKMDVLVLGGTQFMGRCTVNELLQRGESIPLTGGRQIYTPSPLLL